MKPIEVLARLRQADCIAVTDGDSLRVRGYLPDELREELREHKTELLALLRYGSPVAWLYLHLGREVRTPGGEGLLLQVFQNRVAVAIGGRVKFYRPDEVTTKGGERPCAGDT